MTRNAHAESPPPRLASAIFRKANPRAGRLTGSGGRGAGGGAPAGASLMDEVRVVWQLPVVVVLLGEGIGRVPAVGLVPVLVEHLGEPLDDGGVVDDDTELAPEVEGAAV